MSDVFSRAPKVELHLHLEGAIPLPTFWHLIEDGGGDPAVPSLDALRSHLAYRDFGHFIDTWWWMTHFLRTAESFTYVAEAVAKNLAAQRIIYAEASFSPTDFARHGLAPQDLAVAIRKGLDRVPEVSVALNVDLVRDGGPQRAAHTLGAVLEVAEETGIRGLTIGGSEQPFPPELFADCYRTAHAAGLRRTAHAGEAAGPESVWGALRSLGVERIGHGVRSVEDPALLEHLVAERIPLEVCPTSNLRTGVAASWEDHPVVELVDAGALVTLSTDDPTMFHCDLAGEFRSLAQRMPGRVDMEAMTLAAVAASWAEPDEQARLAETVTSWWGAERQVATDPGVSGFSTS